MSKLTVKRLKEIQVLVSVFAQTEAVLKQFSTGLNRDISDALLELIELRERAKSGDRNIVETPPKCIEVQGLDVIEISSPATGNIYVADEPDVARKD